MPATLSGEVINELTGTRVNWANTSELPMTIEKTKCRSRANKIAENFFVEGSFLRITTKVNEMSIAAMQMAPGKS